MSPRTKKILKITGVVGGVAALLVALAGFFLLRGVFAAEHESGVRVARVDWLPKEATDITFERDEGLFWMLNYECAFPRVAFDSYAKANGWVMAERKNYQAGFRFRLKLPPVRVVDGQPSETYPLVLVHEYRKRTVVASQRFTTWNCSDCSCSRAASSELAEGEGARRPYTVLNPTREGVRKTDALPA